MRKISNFILFILVSISAWGQEIKPEFPQTVPPEVYQFIKYGDLPVSEYNGTVGVSIPIYKIQEDGLEYPLNLTYHTGGIRVTDEASCVGLGWDIQFGSVVQTVQGENDLEIPLHLPDFHSSALISPMTESTASKGSQPLSSPYYGFYSFVDYLYSRNAQYENWQNNLLAPMPVIDMEPDIFVASFNGHNVKFIIDPNNSSNFKILNKKGYLVKRSSNLGWIITAPDGVQYIFDEDNKTSVYSSTIGSTSSSYSENFPKSDFASDFDGGASTGTSNSTTWQISKIITKNKKEVNFSYKTKRIIKNQSMSYQWDLYSSDTPVPYFTQLGDFGPYEFLSGQFSISDNPKGRVLCSKGLTETEISYIDRIEFMNGDASIIFSLSDRTDLTNGKKIDGVKIHYGVGVEPVRSFDFGYDYFVSDYTGCGYVSDCKTQTELTHRLKLKSVTEAGKNPYTFIYNSTALPPKNSFAQDYWGYYNGKLDNTSILPNVNRLCFTSLKTLINLPENMQSLADLNETNNSSNIYFAKACILEGIVYPTKGKSAFEFELNTFDNQILPDYDFGMVNKSVAVSSTNLTSNAAKDAFYIEGNQDVTCEGLVRLTSNSTCNLSHVYASIYRLSSSVKSEFLENEANFWGKFNANLYSKDLVYSKVLSQQNSSISEALALSISPSYLYVAVVHTDSNCSGYPSNTANLQLSVKYLPPFNQTVTQGNGLRIKMIRNYSDETLVGQKNYSYEGGKVGLPRLFAKHWYLTQYYGNTPVSSKNFTVIQLQSSNFVSVSPLGFGGGVGYDKVIVSELDYQNGKSNGRIEKAFTNQPDNYLASSPMTYMQGISLPSYRLSKQNGLVENEKIFDASNNLLVEKEYNYHYYTYEKFYGARYYYRGQYYRRGLGNDGYTSHLFCFYPIFCNETILDDVVTTNKYVNKSVSQVDSYLYDTNNLITRKTTTINGGEESIRYNYPYKIYTPGNEHETAIKSLYDANRLTEILSVSKYDNSSYIEQKSQFFKVSNNLTLPSKIISYSQMGKSKEDAIYDLYDNEGNLLQYSLSTGITVSYVWGYNKHYPVAQIENASYDESRNIVDTEGNIFQKAKIDAINSFSGTPEQYQTLLDEIRSTLTSASVSTFTYKPLVGQLTSTDMNGVTTYYKYDDYGRLLLVKDSDENILKTYEYNYKK